MGRVGRGVGEEVELEEWDSLSSESEEPVWCQGRVPTPRTRLLRLGSLGKGTAVPLEKKEPSPASGREPKEGKLVGWWWWG